MKKSTKKLTLVLVSVLIFVLCIGVMVACDNLSDHDFSGEWKMDGTKHWKECECGAKGLETAHIDIDENGTCDICGYDKMHVHSYGDWKSDGVNHWKECSCGEQIEKSAHVQGDGEKCSICHYDMHEHSYGEWKSNETNHWKECSCGLKSEEGAHVDSNNDEKCDTCNYDMHKHSYIIAKNADGHWDYCTSCQDAGEVQPHVDSDKDCKCDVCGYSMHIYGEWKSDESNHWKECSCGAKSGEGAHVDEDNNGICDTCEYEASLKVTVKDSKGNGIEGVELEINSVTATTNENGVATFNMFAPDDELIYFNEYPSNYYKDKSYYTSVGTYAYEITLISEVTNTFAIVDYTSSEPISNVTLKLMDGETVVASGTTDSEGKVTLTYSVGQSGKYYYAIDGLASDKYLSKGAGVTKYYTSENPISINVLTYAKYTITVKCDEGVEHSVEGLTVTVGSYTGTTNASGIAEVLAPASSNLYTVSVSGLEEGYEAEEGEVGYDWWENTTTYATTLIIKAKSEGGDEGGGSTSGNALVIGNNTVNASYFGESYTLTATEAGDYTISSEDPNFALLDPNEEFDAIWGPGSHTFTLSAGESVTVLFSTNDYSNSDSYDVKVEFSAGTQATPIPDGFIGNWIDESNGIYTITSSLIMDPDWGIYKVGEDVTVVSDSEITLLGTTWTLTRDGRILISGEDMDPIYLAVKYPTLYEGETTVDASYYGETYEFTASVDGTYIISTESDIACIVISTGDEIEGAGSVSIPLEADQTILISFMTDGNDAQYDVNISQVYPSIEEGTHTITTDANGKKYTLTATKDGTYTISCDSTNCFITEKNYLFDSIFEGGSASIALTTGDKITICFYTYNDQEDTYTVTISYSATSGGGEQGGDEDPSITFPEDLRDTWYADMNGESIEIVIGEHSISMGDIDGSGCYVDTDETLGTLYKFSIEGWEYFIYSDGTDWYVAQRQRNNIVSYKLSTEEPTADIFPEGIRGTWYTILGTKYVIEANQITRPAEEDYNTVYGYNYATSEDGSIAFMMAHQDYTLTQKEDGLYLNGEKLSSTAPTFLEAIDDALLGTWTNETVGTYEIKATSIIDPNFWEYSMDYDEIKVISATKVVVVSNGEVAFTLEYNDGVLSYIYQDYNDNYELVTITVTMSKKLTQEEIVNAVYALAKNGSLEGTYTLTGKIISIDEPYNSSYNNITVTIVVGNMTDKPIKCYHMKGTGADVIAVNDTIAVTGSLCDYSGTKEFNTGCTLDSYTLGTSTISVGASSSDKATVKITDNKTEGENGSEFTFTVDVENGYSITKVTVNGDEVTAEEKIYTATIKGNTTIIVETAEEGAVTYTSTVSIADYAKANNWITTSGTTDANLNTYREIKFDEVATLTISATDGNSGKYYSNGLRTYQAGAPTYTFKANEGYSIVSVKVTYTLKNGGTLLNGTTVVASIDVVSVNADTITLSMGNTQGKTNGQVIITAIEVVYAEA